jgi:hypothetical protein
MDSLKSELPAGGQQDGHHPAARKWGKLKLYDKRNKNMNNIFARKNFFHSFLHISFLIKNHLF